MIIDLKTIVIFNLNNIFYRSKNINKMSFRMIFNQVQLLDYFVMQKEKQNHSKIRRK